ncbi:hypothetical protein ACFSKL_05635 [Belliella marina]|uniref:Uncharacterized protein n=1 Tax=Belliella marina TaxID=1644146 RepID=A0ABW4VHV1_9BACT
MKSIKYLLLIMVLVWCCPLLATLSNAQQRKVIRASQIPSEKAGRPSQEFTEEDSPESDDCDEDELSKKFKDNELLRIFSFPCGFQGAEGSSIPNGIGGGSPSGQPSPDGPDIPTGNKQPKIPKTPRQGPPAIMHFDKKISYALYTLEGELGVSYFYHSTAEGLSIKDTKALEKLSREKMEAQMHQVFDPNNERFMGYIKSKEGSFFTNMDLGGYDEGNSGLEAKDFLDSAIKSGRKSTNKFLGLDSEEYVVNIDGKKVGVWLAKSPDVEFSGTSPRTVLGFSGLGYVYDGKGKTYLLIGMRDSKSLVMMIGYEDADFSFDTRGYQGMNSYLADQLGAAAFDKGNPNGYNTMVEKQNSENWSNFMESNNILSLGEGYDNPEFSIEVFDLMIASMDNHILGAKTALSELQNNNGVEASKRRAEAQCNLNCYTKKKSELESLKKQVLAIQKNNKLPYDEKQDQLDEIYEKFGATQSKPCDCWD